MNIVGVDETLRKLNEGIAQSVNVTQQGLIRGGLFIQREAQKQVPVRFGNLKASAFTIWNTQPVKPPKVFAESATEAMRRHQINVVTEARRILDGTTVMVGFAATYALVVHENVEAHHTVGTHHYLSKVLARGKQIIDIIGGRA